MKPFYLLLTLIRLKGTPFIVCAVFYLFHCMFFSPLCEVTIFNKHSKLQPAYFSSIKGFCPSPYHQTSRPLPNQICCCLAFFHLVSCTQLHQSSVKWALFYFSLFPVIAPSTFPSQKGQPLYPVLLSDLQSLPFFHRGRQGYEEHSGAGSSCLLAHTRGAPMPAFSIYMDFKKSKLDLLRPPPPNPKRSPVCFLVIGSLKRQS